MYSGGDFEVETLIPAFIAAPVGYIIFASVTGFTPIFGSVLSYEFTQPRNLLIYALLGIVCGLVGKLHTWTFYSARKLFAAVPFTRYARPMVGAAVAGAIGIFFPEVLGLGYGFIQMLINGNLSQVTTNYFTLPLLWVLILIVFFKIIATAFTVGSGGSAGVFAPSLVIGAFVGAAFWIVVNWALPGWIPIPGPLIVVGMMALFGGVGRVPIAVMLMVSEMTGTLTLLAPSMVAVVIAYFVTGPKFTIYRNQVPGKSESPAHRGEYNVPLLTKIHVMDALNVNVVSMSPDDSAEKAFNLMLEKGYRGIPIVESERVVGIVTMSDIGRVAREKLSETQLKTIMTKNVIVAYPDETLLDVLNKMTINGIGRLPVISKETGALVGLVTRTDVIKAYDRAVGFVAKAEPVKRDE